MTTPTSHLSLRLGVAASFPPAVSPNKWIVIQCITWTHGLEHSPSVGGNDAQVEVVLEAWDGYPITGNLYHFPSLASHGHAIGFAVKSQAIPSYLMVIGTIVFEVLAPVPHAIVPPVAPFAAAFVVSVRLEFVPSPNPDLVALPIAALEA